MKLKHHIICGSIVSLCLFPKIGFFSGIFWAASVLIDVDHYIDFLYRNRLTNFSFKKMFDYCNVIIGWNNRPYLLGLSIFHTGEVIGGTYFISVWIDSDIGNAIFLGMVFHMFLDVLYLLRRGMLFRRVFLLLEYFIRKNLMIRNGLSPDVIYKEALIVANVNMPRIHKLQGK